jgi:LCP family protein required for cell wall assembly
MRRTTVLGLVAVPFVIGGLYALMLHGYLELTAYLLGLTVLGLLVACGWEWRRGHPRWAAVLLAGALLTAGTVGTYGWELNKKLDNIHRINDADLQKGNRPQRGPSKALNILLLGSDSRDPNAEQTIADSLADGSWTPGQFNSDTMMVVHIPADRKAAYVVSIPRDDYVPIYDAEGVRHGSNKINSAFSNYGPFGSWRTVENLSGLRLDHMAIIDFAGFRELTSAIGGVDVYVPETVYDEKQDQQWDQGWTHLEGDLALKYVRMRHGLLNGDFDRVARQQNFLRAVMSKTLADGTIGNPLKLSHVLDAITSHLTVDQSWTSSQIRGLAVSLRGLSPDKVTFLTLPLDHYETLPDAGAVNIIDEVRARALWKAVTDDAMARYVKDHPEDELADPHDVS